ncbi:hypothetical protein [Actinoplanes sp. NPDC049316]|uniref:HdeD family acid-resistance protein n=1 Tax=Actinoplanes sp. NPDC049316 TaxID=3154727 RepID=UPI0034277A85
MLWSGSSPLTVVRDAMWAFLLFAGVAWLAIGWSVLRLEPAGIADVAGPVVLFAAATEAVRAFAGTRTWWLNAGLAVLFAATGVLLIVDGGGSWTTPGALIGWYLMARGAADIAISMMTRETDRIWGLLTVVGVAELGLGFFGASSYSRTPEVIVLILAGAAVLRGVADLVASLRLREASAVARGERLLELSAERAIGVAGYSAGMTDFEDAPSRGARARHRAVVRGSAAGMSDLSTPRPAAGGVAGGGTAGGGIGGAAASGHGVPGGPAFTGGPAFSGGHGSGGSGGGGAAFSGGHGSGGSGGGGAAFSGGHGSGGSGGGGPAFSGGHGSGGSGGGGPEARAGSFHDEVLRTTADLDTMLALAGVTGAAVPGAAKAAAEAEEVEVPDTAEGAETPPAEGHGGEKPAVGEAAHAVGRAEVRRSAGGDEVTAAEASPASPAAGSADDTAVTRGLVD